MSLSFPGWFSPLSFFFDHVGGHKVHLLARVHSGHVRHRVQKGPVGSHAKEAVPRQDLARGWELDADRHKPT